MLGHDAKKEAPGPFQPESTATRTSEDAPGALPYATPCLRYLGSVRKLTLASTGLRADFSNGRHRH
jgi:hypothetical protein